MDQIYTDQSRNKCESDMIEEKLLKFVKFFLSKNKQKSTNFLKYDIYHIYWNNYFLLVDILFVEIIY